MYLVNESIEAKIHNQEYSIALTMLAQENEELKACVGVLQSLVNDLRWRMNDMCKILHLENKYDDL